MTDGLDEDTVDFRPNYDGQEQRAAVLPAAFPNLLVNGASGIAVGMATNMPPHNLVEVVAAARHLITHPDADLDDLMRFVPGPDLPTGGKIVGLDGIREAYETGRGTSGSAPPPGSRTSPRAARASSSPSCPTASAPSGSSSKIKDLVRRKKLQGIADVKDLTDREQRACAWSSRSRTASTPRPCSSSSTG